MSLRLVELVTLNVNNGHRDVRIYGESGILKPLTERQGLLETFDRPVQLPAVEMHRPEHRVCDVGTQDIGSVQRGKAEL